MRRLFALLLILCCSALVAHADRKGNKDDDDRIRFGHSIVVGQGEAIHGDAVCVACSIINRGTIEGDAVSLLGHVDNEGGIRGDSVVFIGHADIRGSIGGDAAVVIGALNVASTGSIGKDASVVMGPANVAPGGVINGKLERSTISKQAIGLLFFLPLVFGLVVTIVLALLCYSVVGHARITTVAGALHYNPGLTFLAGLIACVAFGFALWTFAHMHTVSGPLVFIACLVLGVGMIVGYTGLSFAIGSRLGNTSPVAAIVIGAIVIAVAQSIPLLQVFFGFAAVMFALGAAALTGFGTHPEWMQSHFGRTVAPTR